MSGASGGNPMKAMAGQLPELRLAPRLFTDAERAYLDFYQLDLGGRFGDVEHSLGYIPSGAHRIAVQVWTRPGATCTLLLVHGYFDHVGLYRHLIGHGLERGCDVVAFDLPGHGLSTGAEAETEDFDEYRCALRDVLLAVEPLPGPRYAIGQSTGGAVIMEYLYRDPPVPLDRIVLLAPLVRPCNWLQVRTAHALLHRFVDRIPRRFADNSQDAEFLAFVRTDPLQSRTISVKWIGALRRWLEDFRLRKPRTEAMLVVQGDADETVDWRYNIPRIRQLFPRARFHFVPGGRHHLANESADIRSDIYKVIDPYLFDSGGQS